MLTRFFLKIESKNIGMYIIPAGGFINGAKIKEIIIKGFKKGLSSILLFIYE